MSGTNYGYEVPEADRERLGHAIPYRFEKIELPAGPRDLPSWSNGAQINWRWGFGNRPDFLLRCRHDPLAFTSGPVWRMAEYEDVPYDAGAKRMGRSSKGRMWLAEQDGVASCHYHSGTIRMVEFEESETDESGKVIWLEKPDYKNGKTGVAQTRKYTMLATDKQEGYAGRAFEITLAAQTIPVWNTEAQRSIATPVEEGTKLKLRGPWHGSAPAGYCEVSYQYDRDDYVAPTRKSWQRKWYERMGYFGLVIKPDILIDILATFQPHIEWAQVTAFYSGKERVSIEPLHPETGLPKGWQLDPAQCDHDFMISNYSIKPAPSDDCRWCRAKRDPRWRPLDSQGRPYAWWTARKEGLTFDRYLTPPPPTVPMVWPSEVRVPAAAMRGLV